MKFVFLQKLLFEKLFSFKIIYSICNLKKLKFQYFLSIACYKETKYVNDCVSFWQSVWQKNEWKVMMHYDGCPSN